MSNQHKRPLFAFVLVAVACAVIMGYSWRAQALMEIIARGDGPALVRAGERVLLGGVQASPGEHDSNAAAERAPTRARESTRPQDTAPRARPEASKTASPRARTTPGARAMAAWAREQREPLPSQPQHLRRVAPRVQHPEPPRKRRAVPPRRDQRHSDESGRRALPDLTRAHDWGKDRDRDRSRDHAQERGRGTSQGWGHDRNRGRVYDWARNRARELTRGWAKSRGWGQDHGHDRGRDRDWNRGRGRR